ncbi:MAG: membrane or secreted protein [Calditrichaeota bacterium]|nr:MAG: membrane or secreted protein [Calditrichota bacterium]MBL1207066.1 membrane or secreted protein [Calditrichota bacterium]NOG46896.1 membrane or secreted protein [Calditrichota bacterium]
MKTIFYSILIVFISVLFTFAQSNKDKVYVDNGILKWTESGQEVALFGVNYSAPFAHAFRAIKKLGLSHKKAIDMDVSQFARLEFDAYRIHVWDREVADSLGNLIENEHLELLDYLIYKLKEKNINIILTPIAWWGPGWPEPDPPSPGFSNNYSKVELLTDPKARDAQQNYTKQFLNHKNKYTGLSYKKDPDIIAFEIINEPGHPPDTSLVTEYINEMASIFREQGVTKPIYYNISQNWSDKQAAAVYNAQIDGISFQWYPTGLVKYAPLKGNYLAHVDHYPVPEISDPNFKNKTRMVYEFDAADVDQSIMYPAMARSFREAGMQWATMFSYDPTFIAAYNTEYSTHYLNLIYTPQKALSLMIAANVFRTLKTYQKFKSYPLNTEFDGFKISYEDDLSELNNGEKFYYSNSTLSTPIEPEKLIHIAGYGQSSLIQTNAKGAYFLDKINDGVWRLELYPDVIDLMNSYGKNSLDNKVRIVLKNPSDMNLNLPGLSKNYRVHCLTNSESDFTASENKISVKPGVYLLSNENTTLKKDLKFDFYNRSLSEYPNFNFIDHGQKVMHNPITKITDGERFNPKFTIISSSKIDTAILYLKEPNWRNYRAVALNKTGKYEYEAEVSEGIQNGIIEYCIYLKTNKCEMSYPAQVAKNPNSWDYFTSDNWRVKVIPKILFNPETDQGNLNFPNVWASVEFNASTKWNKFEKSWLNLNLTKFKRPINDFTFQIELNNDLVSKMDLSDFKYVEFEIDLQKTNIRRFKFQLINTNYQSVQKDIDISENKSAIRIPLSVFKSNEFVLLPRPYPHFLPYSFKNKTGSTVDPGAKLNYIQISIPTEKFIESANVKTLQFSSIRLSKN